MTVPFMPDSAASFATQTPVRQRLAALHDRQDQADDQQCSVQHGQLVAPYKSHRSSRPAINNNHQSRREHVLKLEDLTQLTDLDCDELMLASSGLEPLQKLDLLKQLDQLTASLQSSIDSKHQIVSQLDAQLKSLKDSIRARNTQMTVELQRLKERVNLQSHQYELSSVNHQLKKSECDDSRDQLKIKQMQQLISVLDTEETAVEEFEREQELLRETRAVETVDTAITGDSKSLVWINAGLLIIICFLVPFYLPHLVVSLHAPNVYAAK